MKNGKGREKGTKKESDCKLHSTPLRGEGCPGGMLRSPGALPKDLDIPPLGRVASHRDTVSSMVFRTTVRFATVFYPYSKSPVVHTLTSRDNHQALDLPPNQR